MPEKRSFFIN